MDIRPSPLGGGWYPAERLQLTHLLDHYLAGVHGTPPAGRILGIVAPHAGLRYAGSTAAHAYACLRGLHPDVVAVLGPLHEPHPAALLTSAHGAYATPLGPVMVDRQTLDQLDQALRQRCGIGVTPVRNDEEHSIEITLPFLQHVLGSFKLLPLMLRDQSAQRAASLGHALAAILQDRPALLVASSDLSHFYPPGLAQVFDRELLRRLAAFDPEGLLAAEGEGVGFACGSGAIAAVLWACRDLGADQVSVVYHATSGDVEPDMDWVVGYGAAVIWQEQPGVTPSSSG